ncbi:olfactory receptor 52D1-like [Notolabrus celidotus]|uniref:olfactory receptor 52D1-like n=1 Tax=Notolabrus celidotus TaxID=1203425 RepID=UPI0014906163|nr:olfactory receptor 52D1-like [Notolabrus celidotus]
MDNSSMFFLSGLSETRNYRFTIFSLTLLCYCFIWLVNGVLIMTIIIDKNLHEPMYIFVCVFCINGLWGSSGLYPKLLWDLLSPVHVISYYGCLIQALVMYTFACSDLSILAVMAYDRYVAICRPLEYHSLMSKQRLVKFVCFSVITPFAIISTNIYLSSRLKLCSRHIARIFCVNWVIVSLACFPAETILNNIVAYITIIIYVLHGVFIAWSYIYLIKTCVNSLDNRAKFMQTCVPHLTSLLTFLLTVLFDIMYIRYGSKDLSQTIQNFIAIEFLVIPPLMNPLIYGFKLKKIKSRILGYIIVKFKS